MNTRAVVCSSYSLVGWFAVHLKFRRSGRNLPSAVGPQELLSVLEGMYRGRGMPHNGCA